MSIPSVRPKIGLLLGDPAGIGPELVAKLIASREIGRKATVVVMGSKEYFDAGQRVAGTSVTIDTLDDIGTTASGGSVFWMELPETYFGPVPIGRVNESAGKSVLSSLRYALKLARAGEIDGILYAPLNKASMHLAGLQHPDELRFFADELGWAGPVGEHNVLGGLWTARVTSHVPLAEVAGLLTRERVLQAIRLLHGSLRKANVETPRIAVAALNPHGGDEGLFGTEETTIIRPAVEDAHREGITAFGPYPADTLFVRLLRDRFDGVVSMYHDQGQIATKLMGFDRGVTVAGGLPVPIATPAHGTAFDIAGQGVADIGAMKHASKLILALAANHRRARSAPREKGSSSSS